ncbi:DUF4303 domain-containing protein [Zafaria sp. J156]|uniref:DUF4303 domain-containing protein n=1 Tax=Zafaria sp. J156 TaxID=3116490 RepID=UPI002E78EBF7|nr:DUF4303 domain-containing protein [Zafaria sp. J156]MEE1619842.1 DUF4303 domain-containing protein [Zafaria sp. J156]
MGVDWTALEEAIRRSALRQAREVIDHHPGHVFYAVALDGVSTEPAEKIELPVLALNSEQALARDLALAEADQAPVDVSEDDVEPAEESFYSRRWNPPDWHWCSMELFDESATELWSQALTNVALHHGWEPTIRRYYEMLLSVTASLGPELATGRNSELVCYLSDEDHADKILRRCLSDEQLRRHFPELAS